MRNSSSEEFLNLAAPILVAALWGSAFVTIKIGLRDFSPISFVTLRFLTAAAGFLILYICRIIRFRPIAG